MRGPRQRSGCETIDTAKRGRLSERDGFTLIEALVAFTILALLTITIQRGVMVAVGGTTRADTRVEAEMVARTLMTGPLGTGQTALQPRSGRLNGLDWALHFEPVALPFPAKTVDGKPPAWMPMRLVIEVSGKNSPRPDLVVKTVRLVKIAS